MASSSGRLRRRTAPTRSMATLRAEGTIDMVDQGTAKESKVLPRARYCEKPLAHQPCFRDANTTPFTSFRFRLVFSRERAAVSCVKTFLWSGGPAWQVLAALPYQGNDQLVFDPSSSGQDNADPVRTRRLASRPARASKGRAEPIEIGGPKGPEPTRYGDWEVGGRCSRLLREFLSPQLTAGGLRDMRHELLREGVDLLLGERRVLRLQHHGNRQRLAARR